MGWKDTITEAPTEKPKAGAKTKKSSWRDTVTDEVGVLESLGRGALQGGTFGLADEISGGIESLFSDKKYEQARDESRKAFEAAEKANPKAYMAGDIGASVATAFVPGLGALNAGKGAKLAEVAGKAAVQGGLTGFGKSEAEGTELALDTAKGAALGGALGSAGYGVAKGVQKGGELLEGIGGKGGFEQASRAFREGAKAGREVGGVDVSNMPIISQVSQGVSGVKNALKEIRELVKEKAEFDTLSSTFGPGRAVDLSDNDILMQKLIERGIAGEPNQAHQLVAAKFAQAHGGDPKQYLNLIKRSPEELKAALDFDVIKAGEDLAPDLQATFRNVQTDAGKQYEALTASARKNFHMKGSYPIGVLNSALKQADKYKSISGNTRAVLEDTLSDLAGREGEVPFRSLSGSEKFDRILAARQRLSKAIKWASKNELPEGQQILASTRAKFDVMLKKLDDMASADKGYSGFKGLEEELFKKLGTVKRGRIQEFDPIKLEALFSGGKTGRGLARQLAKARDMLNQGKLPPESAKRMQTLLDKIDAYAEKAALRRDINAFRYGDSGPSGPAVERMSAIAGKDSAALTAVRRPRQFIGMKAATADAARSMFGKTSDQLTPQEAKAVARYVNWITENDSADPNTITRMIQSFKDPKFKP